MYEWWFFGVDRIAVLIRTWESFWIRDIEIRIQNIFIKVHTFAYKLLQEQVATKALWTSKFMKFGEKKLKLPYIINIVSFPFHWRKQTRTSVVMIWVQQRLYSSRAHIYFAAVSDSTKMIEAAHFIQNIFSRVYVKNHLNPISVTQ